MLSHRYEPDLQTMQLGLIKELRLNCKLNVDFDNNSVVKCWSTYNCNLDLACNILTIGIMSFLTNTLPCWSSIVTVCANHYVPGIMCY